MGFGEATCSVLRIIRTMRTAPRVRERAAQWIGMYGAQRIKDEFEAITSEKSEEA